MKHLLIVGRPGAGKTTLIRHLARAAHRCAVDGFVTEELREKDERMGFWLSPLDGRQILLAHRHMASPVRVGPYKVNVPVLEQVAIPVIRRGLEHAFVLFLDELGRMELRSPAFEQAVQHAFDHGPFIIATAGLAPLPFVTQLKRRKDVEIVPLTVANREAVKEELTLRLEALCAEDEAVRALQAKAGRICEMIVSGEPLIDIDIQQQALREEVARLFPDKQSLYQLVYESRFRRLWQQFRHDEAAG